MDTEKRGRIPSRNGRVILIAMDQPLDSDAHFRGKMAVAEDRAVRQASRFPDLDLPRMQKEVHQTFWGSPCVSGTGILAFWIL